MRPTRSRRFPTLTTPILLQAQVVLATTHLAWQVRQGGSVAAPQTPGRPAGGLRGVEVATARLVSRVYRNANASLRSEMLSCLLRPLGTLSLVAVASGAFATLLQRDGAVASPIPAAMAAAISSDQIHELALFVHEVNPLALEHLTTLLSGSAMGAAAFSASALVLLYRKLRHASAPAQSLAVIPAAAAGTSRTGAAVRT